MADGDFHARKGVTAGGNGEPADLAVHRRVGRDGNAGVRAQLLGRGEIGIVMVDAHHFRVFPEQTARTRPLEQAAEEAAEQFGVGLAGTDMPEIGDGGLGEISDGGERLQRERFVEMRLDVIDHPVDAGDVGGTGGRETRGCHAQRKAVKPESQADCI